jgi:hypothetical protein
MARFKSLEKRFGFFSSFTIEKKGLFIFARHYPYTKRCLQAEYKLKKLLKINILLSIK